tara:strand:+ start:3490 stop:3783 length:294 start_codon:yes stop_codon:yes gene_type:complete
MSKDNNKEHELMKEELEKFRTAFEMLLEHSRERSVKVDEMVAKIDAIVIKVDEMYKPFTDGRTVGKAIYYFGKWAFGVFVGTIGAVMLWKQFIYGQN